MKKIVLQLPYNTETPIEVIENNFKISKVDKGNKKDVEDFLNKFVNGEQVALEKAFVVSIPNGRKEQTLGLFCFCETDIRTKLQVEDDNKYNFNELSHFIIDEKLMDELLLKEVLEGIFPLIVTDEYVAEIIWFEYNGEIYRQRVNDVFKRYKQFHFSFSLVAEYFVGNLISI